MRSGTVLIIVGLVLVACGPPPTSRGLSAPPFPTVAGRSQTPVPTSSPIVIRGTGPTETEAMTLPAPISIAHLTHAGRNAVGVYDGFRPLFEGFAGQAEHPGRWRLDRHHHGHQVLRRFGGVRGKGDAVRDQFNPPARQTWRLSNTGQRSFVVYAHCVGGDDLVLNRFGSGQGSMVVQFGRGPCYWEVVSDGSWSIRPN